MKIAVIADDLTGANADGALLTAKGFPSATCFDLEKWDPRSGEVVLCDFSESKAEITIDLPESGEALFVLASKDKKLSRIKKLQGKFNWIFKNKEEVKICGKL